jgi:hypothetical protein
MDICVSFLPSFLSLILSAGFWPISQYVPAICEMIFRPDLLSVACIYPGWKQFGINEILAFTAAAAAVTTWIDQTK